jgi:thiol-disulfide isomerase/thioredoxin
MGNFMRDRDKKATMTIRCGLILVLSLIIISSLCTCSTKNLLHTQKLGSVFVNSTPPGGNIFVDHFLTGKVTPDTVFGVAVGNRVVAVSKEGYLTTPDSIVITVEENKIDTAEFVLLETTKGSLKVTSNVDSATICIDNKPTTEATTHVFFNSVPIGTHVISVFKAGYSNENPAKEIVNVVTEDTVEVDFILTPADVGQAVGNITPDFYLQDDYGDSVRYYAYRGFVTMIFFWAKGCEFCMTEMPYVEQIYKEYQADTLVIFGINYEDSMDVIQDIRLAKQITFTFLKGGGTTVKSDFGVVSTPVTIILDRSGKIYYYKVGYTSNLPGILRQKLDVLFGKQ